MSAPDELLRELLIKYTDTNGNISPSDATGELSELYVFHPEWIDRHKLAAKDFEDLKKRDGFKPGTQEDFYAIVVLGEGKERRWAFFGNMTKQKILDRIALITKKDEEHHEATEIEIAYWNQRIR